MVAGRGLLGAARFYDAQVDDARLTLMTAKSAHFHGAVMANHARVTGLKQAGGRVVGAQVVDELSGREIDVQAKVIINATGVWVDTVRRLEEGFKGTLTRPTKGIHLVIPRTRLNSQHAVVFDSPRDRRHVFLIPWGGFCLVGTTDTDYQGGLDSPSADANDVAYLLEAVRHTFPGAQIEHDDVISTFAGLRPLISSTGGTYGLSREHKIVESPSGLVTVAGGKLTTHRLMGKQLTDHAQKRLARDYATHAQVECHTEESLEGAQTGRVRECKLETSVSQHLIDTYGSDATWILAYAEENPSLGERIVPELPYLMAEALHAVQHEMALTLSDVLIRRTHVIYETQSGGRDRARAVAEVMAPRLGWDAREIERQVADYVTQVALTQEWRAG
jgi:glycerol-3-phosphate dehydrogenase